MEVNALQTDIYTNKMCNEAILEGKRKVLHLVYFKNIGYVLGHTLSNGKLFFTHQLQSFYHILKKIYMGKAMIEKWPMNMKTI